MTKFCVRLGSAVGGSRAPEQKEEELLLIEIKRFRLAYKRFKMEKQNSK